MSTDTQEPEAISGELVQRDAPTDQPASHPAAVVSALDRAAEVAMAMPGVPGRDEFLSLAAQAKLLSLSGAAPKLVRNNPHIAFHVAMVGRDLGISPTAALALIDVLDTKGGPQLSLSPQLLNAQITRLGLGSVRPIVQERDRCIAGAFSPEGVKLGETEFTWADAQDAQLVGPECQPGAHVTASRKRNDGSTYQACGCNQGYRTYPKRMMWWRACLPERAEALTPTGWVTHDKLATGDVILGFNPDTGRTAWATVEAVNVFDARQTYTIEHRTFRAVATAGHEWVTDDWRNPGRWEKRRTDALDGHPYRRLLAAAPMDDTSSDVSVEDAARLGWVITDGTIQWRGNSPTITISQSKHLDAVCALFGDRCVEDVLDRPGGFGTSKPEHRFRLGAAESRRLLLAGGIATKADAAVIPARLNNSGRRAMFDAMMLANGEEFCTGHEAVWDCWVILATMLGHRVGRPARQRGSIRGRVNGSPVVSVKRLSVEPDRVEPVWCPTTSLGTWVARIDGQVTITGNSGFCANDFFPSASVGLYSPEELGAVVDEEGRPIDPAQVALPPGYNDPIQEKVERQATADAPASPADLWAVQELIYALPPAQGDALREAWRVNEKLKFWTLRNLPKRLLPTVRAMANAQWATARREGADQETGVAVLRERLAGIVGSFLWVGPALAPENGQDPPGSAAPEPQEPPEGPSGSDTPAEPATGHTEPPVEGDGEPDVEPDDGRDWRPVMRQLAQDVMDLTVALPDGIGMRIGEAVAAMHHTVVNSVIADAEESVAYPPDSPIGLRRMAATYLLGIAFQTTGELPAPVTEAKAK